MSATPPHYRTLDRPAPGLATITEPDGREALWVLNRGERHRATCAQCGAVVPRYYYPSNTHRRARNGARLCRPCVEDVQDNERRGP
jgi:hypothetical protein